MYQVVLKGYFEAEDPDKFVESVIKLTEEQNVDLVGQFSIFRLPDDVDYQKVEFTNPNE